MLQTTQSIASSASKALAHTTQTIAATASLAFGLTTTQDKARMASALDKIRLEDPDKFATLPGIKTGDILDAFANIDLDENGYLGAMELRFMLKQLGEDSPDEVIDEMIRMVDSEGIGQCSVEDFWRLLHNPVLVAEMQTMKPGGRKEGSRHSVLKENEALQTAVHAFAKDMFVRQKDKDKKKARGPPPSRAAIEKEKSENYGLKPHQLQKIYDRFCSMDKDDSGSVDYQEFCLVLMQPDSVMMARLFGMFDTDKNGSIDMKEFIVGLANYTASSKEERLKFAFMMFDEDSSGFIEYDELCKIVKSNLAAEASTAVEIDKRVNAILEVAGVGPYGKLDLRQFLKVARSTPGIMFPAYALQRKMDEVMPRLKL